MPARFLSAHEATATTPDFSNVRLPAASCWEAVQLHQQLPPPHAGLRMSIIIPAKNEAVNLPATLAALAAQTDLHGQPLPAGSVEVIVLANNCTDATAAVVQHQVLRWPQLVLHGAALRLPAAQAHVGRARRLLMDAACARLEQAGHTHGIIASTDADTRVAPTWVAAIEAEIAAGADAVGGRILTEITSPDLLPLRRIQLRDAAYRQLCARLEDLLDPAPADPWPRHHQHFGASLALTASAYRRVGGLPEVRFLEDEALCQALRRHDLTLRHSLQVQVLTSARREGRVEVGLSWQLREWLRMSEQQREPHVDSPAQLAALWVARHQLRAARASMLLSVPASLAQRLNVPAEALLEHMQQTTTFGELWEWVLEHGRAHTVAQVPLALALLELPLLIKKQEQQVWSSPAARVGCKPAL